jgi:hypothetical protein
MECRSSDETIGRIALASEDGGHRRVFMGKAGDKYSKTEANIFEKILLGDMVQFDKAP